MRGAVLVMGLVVGLAQPVSAAPRSGMASWYSRASTLREGKTGRMANGHVMQDEAFTAASWEYPFGTSLIIKTTRQPIRSVLVTVRDRGPSRRLVAQGRLLDLSPAAFQALAPLAQGVIKVSIEPLP